MRKLGNIFILLMIGIMASLCFVGCVSDTQNESDKTKEDLEKEPLVDSACVYFITDESYESYVRNCAIKVGADEQWILDVLNGGDGGEWYYMIRPKSWFRCTIVDNQITVSNMVDSVYDISNDGYTYQGSSITKTISFWFHGDILYLKDNDETLKFKKDSSYQRAETEDWVLAAPQDIIVSSGGKGLNYVQFLWGYQSNYGSIGAAIEVKTSGTQEYKTIENIERVYMNMLVVELDESSFEIGENFVRIYHIGGPSITNKHFIIVNKNSDYTTFRVTVSDDRSVNVEEINLGEIS